jgi:carboxyl-terminal processing protease
MFDGLDRYSTYMSRQDFDDLEREGDQKFVGMGVELERRNGRIQITRVVPGSPAADAHWQVGDRIIAIGDTDTRDVTVPRTAELLRGPEGTEVRITRERLGLKDPLVDTVKRRSFDIPTVREAYLRPDGVGYVSLSQFGRRSGEEFAAALRDLEKQGMRGLILDLRDDPGGLLDSTVEVLNPLLPAGSLVVFTKGSDEVERKRLLTTGGATRYAGPMAVLVNDNSASAAEIVSGALQDWKRAVIVGQRTFGKGLVQSLVPLSGGGGVRLTTEAYYLPKGRTIHEKGVEPDVPVPLSDDDRLLQHLQRTELKRLTPEEFARAYGFKPQPDPQLETAAALVLAENRPSTAVSPAH